MPTRTATIALITISLLAAVVIGAARVDWARSCDYRLPEERAGDVTAIVAFAFGNRSAEDGSLVPGPINVRLAEVTTTLQRHLKVPVHAQWEIAQAMLERDAELPVHPIAPVHDTNGDPVYLSTLGLIEQVAERTGSSAYPRTRVRKRVGPVLVVAHADHACRCVESLRARGFDAYRTNAPLPDDYDPESTQAWTRSRTLYRFVDRLASLRAT